MPNRSPSQAELLSPDCDLQKVVELFEIINLLNELSFILTFQIVIEYALRFVNILAIISEVADKGCHAIHSSLIVFCSTLRADCFTLSVCLMAEFLWHSPWALRPFSACFLKSSLPSSHVNIIYPFAHRVISHSWGFWIYFFYSCKAASGDICTIIGENLDGSETITENKPFCSNKYAPPFSSTFHSRNTKVLDTWPCSIVK